MKVLAKVALLTISNFTLITTPNSQRQFILRRARRTVQRTFIQLKARKQDWKEIQTQTQKHHFSIFHHSTLRQAVARNYAMKKDSI